MRTAWLPKNTRAPTRITRWLPLQVWVLCSAGWVAKLTDADSRPRADNKSIDLFWSASLATTAAPLAWAALSRLQRVRKRRAHRVFPPALPGAHRAC